MAGGIMIDTDEVVLHLEEAFDRNDRRYLRGQIDLAASITVDKVRFLVFHPDDRDPLLKICDRDWGPDKRRRRRSRRDDRREDRGSDEKVNDVDGGPEDEDYFEGAVNETGNR